MSEEKTVAEETNAPVADAAVEKRTDDVADLDTLLAEFDQSTKKPADSPPEPKKPALDEQAVASINFLTERVRQEDVAKSVKNIFGDLDIDEDMKRAWLVAKAGQNPAIEQAFNNRFNDPGTWQKFEKSLAKEVDKKYGSKFSKVDEDATADHAAVAHAVRGASAKVAAEPPPDFSKMSDAELRRYTQENWGFSV